MGTFLRYSGRQKLVLFLALFMQYQNFRFCRSLNEEGWKNFSSYVFSSICWKFNHMFFRFLSISSFSQTLVTGLALLRFKEGILSDPFGALATWNDDVGVLNPCFWNRIQCDNGNVVSL